jgi:glycosyltransferase involved in cell wall biosynthesis
LAQYYQIELVTPQKNISPDLVKLGYPIRDSQWLLEHGHEMDYVVYQFGNSLFHSHMLSLLELVPGIVVLHDFFLSDLLHYFEFSGSIPFAWTQALYHSHGYGAVKERYQLEDPAPLKSRYPVNLELLEQARGVIVHSQVSKKLAQHWYGAAFAQDWQIVPLVRAKKASIGRSPSREQLGIPEDHYVVCSFGFLDEVKLNHLLLQCWLASSLSKNTSCQLIFVGQNQGGEYGQKILEMIEQSGLAAQIHITGWTDELTYQRYLESADCAVQLRRHSRGETSAAVLDCLCYGIPTIANAHGSLAELPHDALMLLDDEFAMSKLSDALNLLWTNQTLAKTLSNNARQYIEERHSPKICAQAYMKALDHIHSQTEYGLLGTIQSLASLPPAPNHKEAITLAQSLMQTFAMVRPKRQLLLDISVIYHQDLKTGIERTARALLRAFIEISPDGYRVEPIYLSKEKNGLQYRYARSYTLEALGCPTSALSDDIVEVQAGDILLGLDLSGQRLIQADKIGLLESLRHQGVALYFILYDILPLQLPQCFPQGMDTAYQQWLEVILKNHGVVCISKAVAQDLQNWLGYQQLSYRGKIRSFHLGADLANSAPSRGLPSDGAQFLQSISGQVNFLMVGTIEPRKGYLQVIDAFTQLWQEGVMVNLIIVGAEGWQALPQSERRTIPQTISAITKHPQFGHQLFWLKGISDEYLEKIYAASQCLIAASEGEGFGLPLIEAATYDLPIIARDLAVFQEVAQKHAYYFSGATSQSLAQSLKDWLALYAKKQHPQSRGMTHLSWQDSARQLLVQLGITGSDPAAEL